MAMEYAARRAAAFVSGFGIGAGLTYLMDPRRGARRRAMLRDKAAHLMHEERELWEKGTRDLRNRGRGLMARAKNRARRDDAGNAKLAERVRSRMGRVITHPSSIDVMAIDGRIVLSGPILMHEVEDLIDAVHKVRGVREVENHLVPYPTGERVPGLQGSGRLPPRTAWQRQVWPPAVRLVATGAGLGATLWGVTRGGLTGHAMTLGGGLLLTRATVNKPLTRLFGIGAAREPIEIRKTITIHAPVEDVYRYWERIENFPRFMAHVREVRPTGDGRRSHWKVEGPTGIALSFDAEQTARIPNRILAWRSLPNQTVDNAGIVHFERIDANTTRIDIQMTYSPPAWVVGHAIAKLFHKDPKSALDDDMVRLKSLLERDHERAREPRGVELH